MYISNYAEKSSQALLVIRLANKIKQLKIHTFHLVYVKHFSSAIVLFTHKTLEPFDLIVLNFHCSILTTGVQIKNNL